MEAAAGVAAAGRGVSLPMNSSQPSRKEWRVVSEHSVRNSGNEVSSLRKPVCIASPLPESFGFCPFCSSF